MEITILIWCEIRQGAKERCLDLTVTGWKAGKSVETVALERQDNVAVVIGFFNYMMLEIANDC